MREIYWQTMYQTLNILFFENKLPLVNIIHIPTDRNLEYYQGHLYMNIFTELNICEMTGILLSEMCVVSSENGGILEEELEKCGFIGIDTLLSKDRFYKSEKEYLSIYYINEKLINSIKIQNNF